ncbi:DNA mismatch repair endonuclease MutL [Desulfonatronovibrio hydrogenovorans]|uniref:DNA mismatch repair endonuclease MutL n=1 Tax=Desulfonatronovibrio hydrogenovorans TaxID=53245 RepID=UPI00048BE001|nr:DNA mismatch repair endonuclease MutL [Desulfonatronovibrio hydrogenovorans]
MSRISILPPELQNQIAAGEVVERPASVVKELMENSIDADASDIQVHLESGGQSRIMIVDNGSGMSSQDLSLALTRHATSKISSLEELSSVTSFGFRGEALPSIASISQFTVSSCPRNQDQGYFLKLIYGNIVDQGPEAMVPGTKIIVENLLANVPARLKFLKTRATESRKCHEAFIRHVLANLKIDFELFSESRSVYRFYPGQPLLERLRVIWPSQVCDSLRDFSLDKNGFRLSGLASGPESAQARADRILFYVNQRPVNDRMLLSAVRQAYKGRLLSREYPQVVLFIDLPPDLIDVNVHPAKNEIRFRNEKEVFSLVVNALKSCFQADIYQSPDLSESDWKEPGRAYLPEEQEKTFQRLKEKQAHFDIQPKYTEKTGTPNPAIGFGSRPLAIHGLTYLGQVDCSFLLFLKKPGTLLIVDQHAAHERIVLEQIKKAYRNPVVKKLVIPEKLSIHPSQRTLLENIWKDLKAMGFILEFDPAKNLSVAGVPDFLSIKEAVAALEDILAAKKTGLQDMFISMACKGAVKAGAVITPDEAVELMKKLLGCPDNLFCPHGRPISRELAGKDLERMFKRR